ncbi:hypothetical protein ABZQ50_28905, partial [Pseudomonas aeruginosa]
TGRRLFILGNSFSKPIPLNPFPFLYIPQFSRFTLLVYLTLSHEVDPATLQHVRHGEIFALGDVCGTANAKTAAAARKQIVVVAENLLGLRSGRGLPLRYDGYGGCPLTVERGRVVLAEFGYAGKLLPTFPLEPTAASRFAWLLKRHVLPWVYWNAMLKGREWLARPGR